MSDLTYTPGSITVVLCDGRRFVYPEAMPASAVVLDLLARGVRQGDIAQTIHVLRRTVAALDRPPMGH